MSATDEEVVACTFRLPRDSWQQLKIMSAVTRVPIAGLVIEGLAMVAKARGHEFSVPGRDGGG